MLYFRRYCLTKTFAAKWGEWGLVWLDEHHKGFTGFLQTPPENPEDLERVDWVCKGGIDVQDNATPVNCLSVFADRVFSCGQVLLHASPETIQMLKFLFSRVSAQWLFGD